jgi:hypothetical protein
MHSPRISVRLPEPLLVRTRKLASESGVRLSDLVRDAVIAHVDVTTGNGTTSSAAAKGAPSAHAGVGAAAATPA